MPCDVLLRSALVPTAGSTADNTPAAAARGGRGGHGGWVGWVRDHRRPLILLAVAVVARVAYWVLATPRYVPISDAGQYYEIARNLASGHGIDMHFPQITVHPTAFRPPLYPGLLALVYWIFGASITAGGVLNLIIGAAAVLLASAWSTASPGLAPASSPGSPSPSTRPCWPTT